MITNNRGSSMRLAAFIGLCVAIGAVPASAQEALGANGPLQVAAVGETRVLMVQGVAADPFVWEWSILDQSTDSDEGRFDTTAISVMYDCDAWTRRALILEAYHEGKFVFEVPLYEEPAPITPGSLVDGAAQVVCAPETNSDGATFETFASARAAMEARKRPSAPD